MVDEIDLSADEGDSSLDPDESVESDDSLTNSALNTAQAKIIISLGYLAYAPRGKKSSLKEVDDFLNKHGYELDRIFPKGCLVRDQGRKWEENDKKRRVKMESEIFDMADVFAKKNDKLKDKEEKKNGKLKDKEEKKNGKLKDKEEKKNGKLKDKEEKKNGKLKDKEEQKNMKRAITSVAQLSLYVEGNSRAVLDIEGDDIEGDDIEGDDIEDAGTTSVGLRDDDNPEIEPNLKVERQLEIEVGTEVGDSEPFLERSPIPMRTRSTRKAQDSFNASPKQNRLKTGEEFPLPSSSLAGSNHEASSASSVSSITDDVAPGETGDEKLAEKRESGGLVLLRRSMFENTVLECYSDWAVSSTTTTTTPPPDDEREKFEDFFWNWWNSEARKEKEKSMNENESWNEFWFHREVSIAYRGTQDISEWIADAKFAKTTMKMYNIPGRVHLGFKQQFVDTWDEIKERVDSLTSLDMIYCDNDDARFVIEAGYSKFLRESSPPSPPSPPIEVSALDLVNAGGEKTSSTSSPESPLSPLSSVVVQDLTDDIDEEARHEDPTIDVELKTPPIVGSESAWTSADFDDKSSLKSNTIIYVVGHSLGASIATIAAACLHQLHYDVVMYNIGSPRTGDPEFVEWYNKNIAHTYSNHGKCLRSWRVCHDVDVFTHVPTKSMGYTHIDNRICIMDPDYDGNHRIIRSVVLPVAAPFKYMYTKWATNRINKKNEKQFAENEAKRLASIAKCEDCGIYESNRQLESPCGEPERVKMQTDRIEESLEHALSHHPIMYVSNFRLVALSIEAGQAIERAKRGLKLQKDHPEILKTVVDSSIG